jgi:ribosomal protein S26
MGNTCSTSEEMLTFCIVSAIFVNILLVRKDMNVKEHERLPIYTKDTN